MKKILVSIFVSFLLMLSSNTYARESEINCYAAAIHLESRGESTKGKEAVAQVIMNRKEHPSFPNTICKVVKQRGQFSWYNRPTLSVRNLLKGSTLHLKPLDSQAYQEARQIAKKAFYGLPEYNPKLETSLYFVHTSVTPKQQPWLKNLRLKAKIGSHKFYSER